MAHSRPYRGLCCPPFLGTTIRVNPEANVPALLRRLMGAVPGGQQRLDDIFAEQDNESQSRLWVARAQARSEVDQASYVCHKIELFAAIWRIHEGHPSAAQLKQRQDDLSKDIILSFGNSGHEKTRTMRLVSLAGTLLYFHPKVLIDYLRAPQFHWNVLKQLSQKKTSDPTVAGALLTRLQKRAPLAAVTGDQATEELSRILDIQRRAPTSTVHSIVDAVAAADAGASPAPSPPPNPNRARPATHINRNAKALTMREQMVEPWATMRKTATAIRFLTWRLRTALISADERKTIAALVSQTAALFRSVWERVFDTMNGPEEMDQNEQLHLLFKEGDAVEVTLPGVVIGINEEKGEATVSVNGDIYNVRLSQLSPCEEGEKKGDEVDTSAAVEESLSAEVQLEEPDDEDEEEFRGSALQEEDDGEPTPMTDVSTVQASAPSSSCSSPPPGVSSSGQGTMSDSMDTDPSPQRSIPLNINLMPVKEGFVLTNEQTVVAYPEEQKVDRESFRRMMDELDASQGVTSPPPPRRVPRKLPPEIEVMLFQPGAAFIIPPPFAELHRQQCPVAPGRAESLREPQQPVSVPKKKERRKRQQPVSVPKKKIRSRS